MTNFLRFALIIISMLFAAGCDNYSGSTNIQQQQSCQGPTAEFHRIQHDFSLASDLLASCGQSADKDLTSCQSQNRTDCWQIHANAVIFCRKTAVAQANQTISYSCGAEVLYFDGQVIHPVAIDTDRDGISNYNEMLMGLNPCSAHSYGNCTNDADFDADGDGIRNGSDPNPYYGLLVSSFASPIFRGVEPRLATKLMSTSSPEKMQPHSISWRSCGFLLS